VAGGGSELRWQRSGGVGVGWSGWEALVGCEEGRGALDFGNVEAEGGVPRSSGARRRGWPPARGFWWLRVAVLGSLKTTSQRGA
jgi:hypothetical protein